VALADDRRLILPKIRDGLVEQRLFIKILHFFFVTMFWLLSGILRYLTAPRFWKDIWHHFQSKK